MRKRLIVPALVLALLGLALFSRKDDGGVRVQAGGDPTTMPETTTTQTPVTTPVPTTAPTTAPTATPVTSIEPTTTAPVEETTTPTNPPTINGPPEQAAAQEVPEAAPVPEAVNASPPATATRVETGKCVADEATCNPSPRAEWQWCEEWHDLAAQVGWPESQGRVLSYVLHRESGCDPHAYNPSPCGKGAHAMGLMQLCGWLSASQAYDPATNLAKGLELWRSSGWCPWVLRGDPVTGRACG